MTRDVEFLSIDYTNLDTNPKIPTTLALTLADHHDAFESSCAPVFCDFVRNYSCTVDGAVVTSLYVLRNTGNAYDGISSDSVPHYLYDLLIIRNTLEIHFSINYIKFTIFMRFEFFILIIVLIIFYRPFFLIIAYI